MPRPWPTTSTPPAKPLCAAPRSSKTGGAASPCGGKDRSPHARPGPDAPPTWIVDPLDGTTNYVHDCPLYCVSIGLQVAGELVVGAVFDPSRQEMFAAAKGHGA